MEPERFARYRKAFEAWRKTKRDRGLKFADYVRHLLDSDASDRL